MRRLPYTKTPAGERLGRPIVVLSVRVNEHEVYSLHVERCDQVFALAVLTSEAGHTLGETVELYEAEA